MVELMQVKCPHGEGSEDGPNTRRRGEDGDAMSVGCSWTGDCKNLHMHEVECEFKVITCSIAGCNHKCRRRDMKSHLSGDGFLVHMSIMQANYEKKLSDMQLSYENRIKLLNKTINDLQIHSNRRADELQNQIAEIQEKINSQTVIEDVHKDKEQQRQREAPTMSYGSEIRNAVGRYLFVEGGE